jgi:HEAT repeat protein
VGRVFLLVGVAASAGLLGCASTWEKFSSKKFKDRPFHTAFGAEEDPLHVLRTSPEGGERAAAMTRLKEPLRNGGSQAEQDEVVDAILGPAAANDPSPVVRAAAIDALGRFQDPRAAGLLIAAYHQAPGRPATDPGSSPTAAAFQLTGGKMNERFGLTGLSGPSGFPADTTALLQSKCLGGLAKAGTPEAVDLLTRVAEGQPGATEPVSRETRLAAVRGLAAVRQPGSVVALQKVLAAEANKDTGLASRAHAGLVDLTGQNLPPDPQKWGEVVQAGAAVAPARSGVERAVGQLTSLGF